jgi:hypothetical protein
MCQKSLYCANDDSYSEGKCCDVGDTSCVSAEYICTDSIQISELEQWICPNDVNCGAGRIYVLPDSGDETFIAASKSLSSELLS